MSDHLRRKGLSAQHWQAYKRRTVPVSMNCTIVFIVTDSFWPRRVKYKNTAKISDLLHRGQGVQVGREVRACQAGRGCHRYQRDRRDPADWGGERTMKSRQRLKSLDAELWSDHIHNQRSAWTTRLSALTADLFCFVLIINVLFVCLQVRPTWMLLTDQPGTSLSWSCDLETTVTGQLLLKVITSSQATNHLYIMNNIIHPD